MLFLGVRAIIYIHDLDACWILRTAVRFREVCSPTSGFEGCNLIRFWPISITCGSLNVNRFRTHPMWLKQCHKHLFGNGLYQLFMVKLGMVCYCFTNIIAVSRSRELSTRPHSRGSTLVLLVAWLIYILTYLPVPNAPCMVYLPTFTLKITKFCM